jgi:hypothetical protein
LEPNRKLLRFFGLLDIVSIIQTSQQVYAVCVNYSQFSDEPSKIRAILLLLCYLLLFISALGLLMMKKYGIITYYIQFPIRLLVWVFSFGFITFFNQYITNADMSHWLLRLVVVMEFFRLYFTVQVHRRYFRS